MRTFEVQIRNKHYKSKLKSQQDKTGNKIMKTFKNKNSALINSYKLTDWLKDYIIERTSNFKRNEYFNINYLEMLITTKKEIKIPDELKPSLIYKKEIDNKTITKYIYIYI